MPEVREVLYSRCCVCHIVIGCYDSIRDVKRQDCNKDCQYGCPNQTKDSYSHGLCEYHLHLALEKRKEVRNVDTERNANKNN